MGAVDVPIGYWKHAAAADRLNARGLSDKPLAVPKGRLTKSECQKMGTGHSTRRKMQPVRELEHYLQLQTT